MREVAAWSAVGCDDLPVIGGPNAWVGPGVIDAHVHLAFGAPGDVVAGGVTAVRDLGAPPERAAQWRASATPGAASPRVRVAGPIVTARGGYPSRSWGRDGFAAFVDDAQAARDVVRRLSEHVDVIKVALEPNGGPVPDADTVAAVVAAAHEVGLGVTAHALTVDTVRSALRAGVDELAHVPTEPRPADVIASIVGADVFVVSTIQTFVDAGRRSGGGAIANARALCQAGARMCYGSDLGNAGTRPGVDPRELQRLADCGLGVIGALRAATTVAATAHGLHGIPRELRVGAVADVVVLPGDPVSDVEQWLQPIAVVVGGRVVAGTALGTVRP